MRVVFFILIAAVWPVWGQIAQSHPEYCGVSGQSNPPLPPDISAIIDPSDGHVVVYIGQGSPATALRMPGYSISEIAEVCPLPDGRLVIFADFGGTDVYIVDRIKASLTDSFMAYFPVMSPDQRWIVYRKFYSLHGVTDASDELLMYDLAKTPAQNRRGGDYGATNPGGLIFPPRETDVPYDNIGVPSDQIHAIGRPLYWAPDGGNILFTDRVPGHADKIILVTIDDRGTSTVFDHEVTTADICGSEISGLDSNNWRIEGVRFGNDRGNGRSISLDFTSSDLHCRSHDLQLNSAKYFKLAKAEVHVQEKPARGMKREAFPRIPPRQEK